MSTITAETLSALAADLTDAVKDIRAARLAFRASIKAIREAGDWTATEHKSWTTFAAEVIGKALPKNTAAIDWTIVAVACAEEGMSVRAIAPIVGKSPAGVSKAVRAAIANGDAEVPEASTGADGTKRKTARASRSTSAKSSKATGNGSSAGSVAVKVSPAIKATGAIKAAVSDAKAKRAQILKASATERATAAKNLRESIAQAQALLQAIEAADAPKAAKAA
ncbi:helix-turn-helix domain-containing protein [Nocardioides sp. W3-2-3]|uniref:hypothetical protein n=1 Tax=Nocardioides convexus TaxID=2712224 RepID=UPI002418AA5F|nr:hypothetical protein [Nocardioides convexus]NHA00334.1 helix-turn-helix domain-containing protein [Nocardioides convexus]